MAARRVRTCGFRITLPARVPLERRLINAQPSPNRSKLDQAAANELPEGSIVTGVFLLLERDRTSRALAAMFADTLSGH